MSYMKLSICLMGIGNSLDTMLIGVLLMACRILVKFNASDIQKLSSIVDAIHILIKELFHLSNADRFRHFIIFIN